MITMILTICLGKKNRFNRVHSFTRYFIDISNRFDMIMKMLYTHDELKIHAFSRVSPTKSNKDHKR